MLRQGTWYNIDERRIQWGRVNDLITNTWFQELTRQRVDMEKPVSDANLLYNNQKKYSMWLSYNVKPMPTAGSNIFQLYVKSKVKQIEECNSVISRWEHYKKIEKNE